MHKPTTTTREFIELLSSHADKALVFEHEGRRIQPDYHVTEIKSASFSSLDCGARPQQWHETIVQLWDVQDEPERGHMPLRKFMGIWRKVAESVALNADAEIKFEWGDAQTPSVHYIFGGMKVDGHALVVSLEPVRATCKPRDEWWLAQEGSVSCCTPAQNTISIADIGAMKPMAQACCD
jgi:hypothetical protein